MFEVVDRRKWPLKLNYVYVTAALVQTGIDKLNETKKVFSLQNVYFIHWYSEYIYQLIKKI